MEQTIISEKKEFVPSVLRQIVDELDEMGNEEQQMVLRRIRLGKLSEKFKALDAKLAMNEIHLTEDEIAEIVSQDRKKTYEQKIRS